MKAGFQQGAKLTLAKGLLLRVRVFLQVPGAVRFPGIVGTGGGAGGSRGHVPTFALFSPFVKGGFDRVRKNAAEACRVRQSLPRALRESAPSQSTQRADHGSAPETREEISSLYSKCPLRILMKASSGRL